MTPGRSSPSCFEFVFRFQVGSARVSPVAIMIETTRGALLRLASSVIGESPQRFSSERQNRSRAQAGGRLCSRLLHNSSHSMGSVYVRSLPPVEAQATDRRIFRDGQRGRLGTALQHRPFPKRRHHTSGSLSTTP